MHAKDFSSFKVPSARLDFALQDEMGLRNVIIPEKEIDDKNVELTGRWLEYRFRVEMNTGEENHHKVSCTVNGDKKRNFEFEFEPAPPKRGPAAQVVEFLPEIEGSIRQRRDFARYVHLQRFR